MKENVPLLVVILALLAMLGIASVGPSPPTTPEKEKKEKPAASSLDDAPSKDSEALSYQQPVLDFIQTAGGSRSPTPPVGSLSGALGKVGYACQTLIVTVPDPLETS